MTRFFTIPRILALVIVAGAWHIAPARAFAQATYIGPGKCGDCHDHEDEKEWSEKRDGDGQGKQHLRAKKQLDDPKAAEWSKAIGLADQYDVKGTCVKCHATVVRGRASFGVSCESCHGAGSDYLTPHQEKGAYDKAVAAGMKDIQKKPNAWVKDCLECHVLGANATDADLAKAGHPTGADFVIGIKFKTVALHWTPPTGKYTENQIAGIGTPLLAGLKQKYPFLTAKAGGAPAAKPAEPAPPPAAEVAKPADPGTPPPPAPPAGGTTPAAPPTQVIRRVIVSSPGLPPPRPQVTTTPPPGGGDPQVIIQLPPDPQLPPTPTGIVASIQGRLVALLANLLTRDVTTPTRVVPPTRKTVYRGADAELLRLQDEVISLALEALSTAPPPKTPPKQ